VSLASVRFAARSFRIFTLAQTVQDCLNKFLHIKRRFEYMKNYAASEPDFAQRVAQSCEFLPVKAPKRSIASIENLSP
jgi:hypothetical protein